MGLDLSKLENVKQAAHGKTTARCPACAAVGGDEKGNHLVIYADGKYGCVANPDDKDHRKEIFSLAGERANAGAPTKITVEAFKAPGTHVIMDLGRFGRFSAALSGKTPKPENPPPVEAKTPSIDALVMPVEIIPASVARRPRSRPVFSVGPLFTDHGDSPLAGCDEAMWRSNCVCADLQNGATDEEIAAFLGTE